MKNRLFGSLIIYFFESNKSKCMNYKVVYQLYRSNLRSHIRGGYILTREGVIFTKILPKLGRFHCFHSLFSWSEIYRSNGSKGYLFDVILRCF